MPKGEARLWERIPYGILSFYMGIRVMGLEEGGRDLPVFYLRLFLYNSPRFCYYIFWEAMA